MSNITINDYNMFIGSQPSNQEQVNKTWAKQNEMLYFLDLTVADNVVTQFADGSWGSMFV